MSLSDAGDVSPLLVADVLLQGLIFAGVATSEKILDLVLDCFNRQV